MLHILLYLLEEQWCKLARGEEEKSTRAEMIHALCFVVTVQSVLQFTWVFLATKTGQKNEYNNLHSQVLFRFVSFCWNLFLQIWFGLKFDLRINQV